MPELKTQCVADLQAARILFVEDGNHGERRPRQHEFVSDGTAFIRAADMADGTVNFDTAEKINSVALKRVRKGFGRPGDILFSHKGTVGKLALVPLDAPLFVCSPQTTFWRSLDSKRLDQRYLYYYMASPDFIEQWMARKGETDMADYVSLTAQRALSVALPEIDTQRHISSILGALDDKIHINLRLNKTLEEAAQALFKSWFVDFDPVQAKRDGRAPCGMNADIAALFPKHFEDSTLGPIPKGWKWWGLDDIASFLNGLALQKYPVGLGSALPVVKIAQLRTENTRDAELASADIPLAYVIDDGDVIFSWSGSLMVTVWCGGKGALNQHLFKVTSDRYPKWFYRQWTEYHLEDFQSIAVDKATTMGHIKRHHLADAKVVVPPDELLAAIDRVMAPMLDRFIHNKIENRTLAALRDTLLPNLLLGEIRVRDAERQMESVM